MTIALKSNFFDSGRTSHILAGISVNLLSVFSGLHSVCIECFLPLVGDFRFLSVHLISFQVMHCSNVNAFSITPLTVLPSGKKMTANSAQEMNAPNRVSWQIRRPSSTASHVVNVAHFRSRSLSQVMPPLEKQESKATLSSNTLGSGLTPFHFSPIPTKSVTSSSHDTSSAMLAVSPEPTPSSFPVSPTRPNSCLQQKLRTNRVNSQDIKPERSYLASVESL